MITKYLLGNSVVVRDCHNGDIHGQSSIATSLDSYQMPCPRALPARQRPPRSGLVQTPMPQQRPRRPRKPLPAHFPRKSLKTRRRIFPQVCRSFPPFGTKWFHDQGRERGTTGRRERGTEESCCPSTGAWKLGARGGKLLSAPPPYPLHPTPGISQTHAPCRFVKL